MLIADDESDMRALMSHVLRAAEIDVIEAATAEETVARFRELRPDAVVLDQRMPSTSGLEVAKTLLADAPDQVIFLFTAMVDAAIRADADAIGITGCISKEQVFEIPALIRKHVTQA